MRAELAGGRAADRRQVEPEVAWCTGAPTWTTSASAATAPTASRAARCASSACSPPQAYDEPVRNVPLIRRKIDRVMARAGLAAGSHNDMRLTNILETYPRDELFQITEDELLAHRARHPAPLRPAAGEAVRAARPVRPLRLGAVLRCRASATTRGCARRSGQMLAEAFGGHVSAYYPELLRRAAGAGALHHRRHARRSTSSPTCRRWSARSPRLARTWSDDFEAVVRRRRRSRTRPRRSCAVWADAFPPGYRDRYGAAEALADLAAIGRHRRRCADRASAPSATPATSRAASASSSTARASRSPLADVLPILDNMGLKALSEEGFALTPAGRDGGRRTVWVHDFVLDDPRGERLVVRGDPPGVRGRLPRGLDRPGRERRLQPAGAGAGDRLARGGADPRAGPLSPAVGPRSQPGGAAAGAERPPRGRAADPGAVPPALRSGARAPAVDAPRRRRPRRCMAEIEEALQAVESLDDDRVLRRLAALVGAIQRTNYYQPGADGRPKPYISFKVASRELADLPDAQALPRDLRLPRRRSRACTCASGPVARGGLRWSRPARRLPHRGAGPGEGPAGEERGDRAGGLQGRLLSQAAAEGRRARGDPGRGDRRLQDLPLRPAGHHRQHRRRRRGGPSAGRASSTTATIPTWWWRPTRAPPPSPTSPTAWPSPTASGSATPSPPAARPATTTRPWASPPAAPGRRSSATSASSARTSRPSPSPCVGVGDMSGDVFGNGMLLSKQTRLVAAFDHRHIFLDPDPDPATSLGRAQAPVRPADARRGTTTTAKLISEGGGVFPRTLKSIPLTPEVKALLDLKVDALTPAELIARDPEGAASSCSTSAASAPT